MLCCLADLTFVCYQRRHCTILTEIHSKILVITVFYYYFGKISGEIDLVLMVFSHIHDLVLVSVNGEDAEVCDIVYGIRRKENYSLEGILMS